MKKIFIILCLLVGSNAWGQSWCTSYWLCATQDPLNTISARSDNDVLERFLTERPNQTIENAMANLAGIKPDKSNSIFDENFKTEFNKNVMEAEALKLQMQSLQPFTIANAESFHKKFNFNEPLNADGDRFLHLLLRYHGENDINDIYVYALLNHADPTIENGGEECAQYMDLDLFNQVKNLIRNKAIGK